MVVCVGGVALFSVFFTPDLYQGTVIVRERLPGQSGVQVFDNRYVQSESLEAHMADLVAMANSPTVLRSAGEVLAQSGIPLPQNRVDATEYGNTRMLRISVSLPNAQEAGEAADAVSTAFREYYRDKMTEDSKQSVTFIEAQLKNAALKLENARQARRKFQAENKVVRIDEETTALIQRISLNEQAAIEARAQSDSLVNQLEALDSFVKSQKDMRLYGETVADNPIYRSLLQEQLSEEAKLGAMLATKGKNHPDVIVVARHVEELQARIKEQPRIIPASSTTQLDPSKLQTVQSLIATQAQVDGMHARVQALEQSLKEQRDLLAKLPEDQMSMAQYDLDIRTAENTYGLLKTKLDEAIVRQNDDTSQGSIQIMSRPVVTPVDKRIPLKLALAFMLSPLLGVGIVLLLHSLDNTVRTPAEAEDLLGLPVTSAIPLSRSHTLAKRPDNEALVSSYGMLTALLWRTVAKTDSPVLLVASAEPEAGRTSTAANLAVTLASDGARVILVDADLRKSSLHTVFGTSNKPGFANVLAGTVPVEDALTPTKVEGLLLLPAGPSPENPVRLLRSDALTEFVAQVGSLADFVVFDSPAGSTFPDAALLASTIKNVVIVHSAGRVPRGAEAEFRTRLDMVGAEILGVVMNKVRAEDSHGHFHYRRFYQDTTAQSKQKIAAMTGVQAISSGSSDEDEE